MKQASSSPVMHHAALALRPSACPGLLRIVVARDGGLCRIKLPGGALSAAQARAIADASLLHAAGAIEVTNRANLQVRGVRSGQEAALIEALIKAGLGPTGAFVEAGLEPSDALVEAGFGPTGALIEAAPGPTRNVAAAETGHLDPAAAYAATTLAADDVRNVMISPAAGRDPFALFDTGPLCAELLALLQSEPRFAALSPKFALLLDGGERLARIDHPHDVWLAATQGSDGVRFVVGLAGCPPEAGSQHADYTGALAAVRPSQVCALIRALLHTFLDLAAADATRMRHLLATHSADALLHHAQRYVDFPLSRDASLVDWQRGTAADATLRLGAQKQSQPDTWHAGGQPPLGRLDAATLHGLATLAQQHGDGTLRMTPWQSVLLPDIATHDVPAVLTGLTELGLATDPAQAVTRLIACAGSSGCAKSLADTKADALQLAPRLPAGADVHLSGCPRSCAAAHCAPYTLLAVAPGAYDLYRRDGQPGFGACVAHRLTIDQAADTLACQADIDAPINAAIEASIDTPIDAPIHDADKRHPRAKPMSKPDA
ncbi:precorrin-3B synthase [Paraburkholderia bryophila]|uniref:Precorrin-3B synthase n=2 Tax=Paraburkholderia bryophila TaxID=420952 RepID=A0A7Y9WA52_9BURK|nr:precorrin-3B synthase [Paraburkholderia bryophila]